MVLVVSEGKFRELASHDVVEGREYLTAAFELHAGGRSRWAPYLVPREQLASRFGSAPALAPPEQDALLVDRGLEGFLGESEVIRRLAESASLNLFRPFPDLETVEVLARHVDTHRFVGLQVKTAGWERASDEERVYVRRSSFRPHPTTYICVLSWDRVAMRFGDDCLLIPSLDISELARIEGEWLVLEMQPGSPHHRRLYRYRTPIATLGRAIEAFVTSVIG